MSRALLSQRDFGWVIVLLMLAISGMLLSLGAPKERPLQLLYVLRPQRDLSCCWASCHQRFAVKSEQNLTILPRGLPPMYMSLEDPDNCAVVVYALEQHGEAPRGSRRTADRTCTAHHRCVRRPCSSAVVRAFCFQRCAGCCGWPVPVPAVLAVLAYVLLQGLLRGG